MRTTVDAIRSLKRYAWDILGEPWEVRWAEEQAAFDRPFAIVGPAGPETWQGPKHRTDVLMPTTIHLYPEQGASPEAALLRALEVSELLYQGFRVGVGYGGSMRVPLWDFAGVGLNEEATKRLAINGDDRDWHGDYMRVNDISVNRVRDPDEPTLYAVIADVRLGWGRSGGLPSEGETLRSARLRYQSDSEG